MAQLIQQGSINTTALVVPGLYVQIVPPQNLVINGVPSNRVGIVGTAQWGPVGQAVIVGSMAQYAQNFGGVQNRKYDMGTATAIAVQQGASDFRCVRVTDTTDTAASAALVTNFATTALYTGTLGNACVQTLTPGSRAGSWRLTVALPGLTPELYDNLYGAGIAWVALTVYSPGQVRSNGTAAYVVAPAGGGTSNTSGGPTGTTAAITDGTVTWNYIGTNAAFWLSVAAAVNAGNAPQRGPSNLVSAASTATVAVPGLSTSTTLSGGTDGVATITDTVLIGVDGASRKGMYSLRGTGCGIALLADADGGSGGDTNQWTTQEAFGLSEGVYMMCVGPAGDTIANAAAIKAQSGLDTYACKLLFGDWLWWSDQVNGVTRLVSPQGFAAGRLANLSPEQSSLNKPLYGVLGSQKSGTPGAQMQAYSAADFTALFQAGIDVIANPSAGGSYWGLQLGHNASSNAAISGDNYTRLTNYIAETLAASMGLFVGLTVNAGLFRQIRSAQLGFLQNLLDQGILGSLDGSLPFSVICDPTNNPPSRTQLNYVQSDASVQYSPINEKFICNIQGGVTVQIASQQPT